MNGIEKKNIYNMHLKQILVMLETLSCSESTSISYLVAISEAGVISTRSQ